MPGYSFASYLEGARKRRGPVGTLATALLDDSAPGSLTVEELLNDRDIMGRSETREALFEIIYAFIQQVENDWDEDEDLDDDDDDDDEDDDDFDPYDDDDD